MREVSLIGTGVTKFGKDDRGVLQILAEAGLEAIKDSKTEDQRFGSLFVANMSSGEFEGKSGIGNALISDLALEPAFATKVENTSGSGGAALYLGWLSVASGESDLTLILGGEKMTSVTTEAATEIIASLTHEQENRQGATLLSFAGLVARNYMERYGATRTSIAKVAVKNHANAMLNPKAQFHKEITVEQVINSPIIADPLRLYDFCPISDGGAAVVLASAETARSFVERPVRLIGVGAATDSHVVGEREDLATLGAVKEAGARAYSMAGKKPKEIQVAELHDMFTLMEIIQSEDLGFFEKGKGWVAAEQGATARGGALPINTSGGLKAKGHPIGATGVVQACEIAQQIQRRCGGRQVDAEVGLACNVAGFGNGAVVSIFEAM